MEPTTTVIRIQGQEYSVRSDADPAYVRRVAAYVDERMREVGQQSNQVSTVRVAILTALNIADELFREREKSGEGVVRLQERARELASRLEPFVRPAGGMERGSATGADEVS